VEEIVSSLEAHDSEWAKQQAKVHACVCIHVLHTVAGNEHGGTTPSSVRHGIPPAHACSRGHPSAGHWVGMNA